MGGRENEGSDLSLIARAARCYENVSVSELRNAIKFYLSDVFERKARIMISRHGRPAAALVPISDLASLHAREEELFATMRTDSAAPGELEIVQTKVDRRPESDILKDNDFYELVEAFVRIVDDRIASSKGFDDVNEAEVLDDAESYSGVTKP